MPQISTPARPDTDAALPQVRRPRLRLPGDSVAIAGFVLLTVLFFWPLFFEPGTYIPKGGGDLASFLYPVYSFAARSLQGGIVPLWNPYLYAGSPFAADMQTGLFYPINLIAFLVARPFTYQTLEALAIVHYFLAAVFAYTYLRVLRLAPLAAFGGGLVFGFSGFLVAHLGHLNMVEAAVWLPLTLAGFHLALRRQSLGWATAAGVVFSVSILPGHVQISLYTGFFLLLYWLWAGATNEPAGDIGHNAMVERTERPARSSPRFFLLYPVTLITAAGIAAIQILPSFELTRLSVRSDITFAKALEFAASPRGLITWLAPHFFGDDAARYWGLTWSLTEVYAYAGVATLVVAGLAIVRPGRRWGWPGFFALMVVLFGLLSIAEHTPLYGWLYRFFPGFDKVRAAGRFSLLVDLSLAVLAAYGLQSLLHPWPAWRRPALSRYLAGLFLLLLALLPVAGLVYYALLTSQAADPAIFQRIAQASDSVNLSLVFLALAIALLAVQRYRRPPGLALPLLAVAVIVVDLFGANLRFNPTNQNVISNYQRDDAVTFLRGVDGPYRIDTETGIGDIWPPNAALLFGIPDVYGIFNPMQLADHQGYWSGLGSRSTAAYDLLNARYLIAKPDTPLDTARFRPVQGVGPLVIYENIGAMPRAFLVPAAEVAPREEMLARLTAPGFDPRATVLLEEPHPLPAGNPSAGEVTDWSMPSPNAIRLTTESEGPAYLFLSEVFYPGWQATIDGRPAEIVRANYLFRAVALPAGTQTVRLEFRPPAFIAGAALSALTLLVLLVWGGWSLARRAGRYPSRPVP